MSFLGASAKLRKASITNISVSQSSWNNSAPAGQIFVNFGSWGFFENLLRRFKFYYNLTRITDTLHEEKYTFLIISCYFFLELEVFQTKVVEKIKTHILGSITFFFSKIVPFMRKCGKIL